jgi:hypothetical protein
MRAYIEPDDTSPFPIAAIDTVENGEVIYSFAWVTTPKKWRIEFDEVVFTHER